MCSQCKVCLIWGLLSLGAQAIGETPMEAQAMRSLHSKMDSDMDGKVSMAEMLAFSKQTRHAQIERDMPHQIKMSDTNGDGKLSFEEHITSMTGGHEEMADGDGTHTGQAEYKKSESAKFTIADEDGNGLLDEKEAKAFFYPETHDALLAISSEADMKSMDRNDDGMISATEFFSMDEDHTLSEEELAEFADYDKDKSGSINVEELREFQLGHAYTEKTLQPLFEIADKDGDGLLTADELVNEAESIAESTAHHHFMGWAEHHGEL